MLSILPLALFAVWSRAARVTLSTSDLLQVDSLEDNHEDSPDSSIAPFTQCPAGDTQDPACLSVCRRLGLEKQAKNGACPDFEASLGKLGYAPTNSGWWNWTRRLFKSSSLDPVVAILKTNVDTNQLGFLVASLAAAISAMPLEKQFKYKDPLRSLTAKIDAYHQQYPNYEAASKIQPVVDESEGTTALPKCKGPIAPGDIATFEVGGPNFKEISGAMSQTAAEEEALLAQRHFSYDPHFEYGRHFDYDPTFATNEEEAAHKRYAKKVANFFANLGKGIADVSINVGKGLADMTLFVGKGLADVTINVSKQIARGFIFTGAGITAVYSSVRQTTTRTGGARFTHSEIATGPNTLTSGQGSYSICYGNELGISHNTKIIVSRFMGNKGTVPGQTAANHRQLAAQRAAMWNRTLEHYADTVGQWHRAIFGQCLNMVGNAGHPDYWKAVTPEKVQQMWDYEETDQQKETGFWQGVRWVKDSFRTHDADGNRVKPKAMFCSKFVSAVWSSIIGNPSTDEGASVRHKEVNQMFPFNPGACSPWTLVQWLIGKAGRKYWSSCIIDTGEVRGIGTALDPCA